MSKVPKLKEPTIDAQQLKRRLFLMAGRIGNRKRITGTQLFNFMMEAVKKVQ